MWDQCVFGLKNLLYSTILKKSDRKYIEEQRIVSSLEIDFSVFVFGVGRFHLNCHVGKHPLCRNHSRHWLVLVRRNLSDRLDFHYAKIYSLIILIYGDLS